MGRGSPPRRRQPYGNVPFPAGLFSCGRVIWNAENHGFHQPVKHRAHHAFHKALRGIYSVRCRQMVCIGHVMSESWPSGRDYVPDVLLLRPTRQSPGSMGWLSDTSGWGAAAKFHQFCPDLAAASQAEALCSHITPLGDWQVGIRKRRILPHTCSLIVDFLQARPSHFVGSLLLEPQSRGYLQQALCLRPERQGFSPPWAILPKIHSWYR